MAPLKLYTPADHYEQAERGQLIDLLKPFWGKGPDFDDAQRVAMYGLSEQEVTFVSKPGACDWAVLPMSWNYYRQYRKMDAAHDLVQIAAAAGKRVLSWISGDFGVRIPHYDNLIVLRLSGYRSKLPAYHQGMPAFISDPLEHFYHRSDIVVREWQERPVIGFCGQAQGNALKYAWDTARTAWWNTLFYIGVSPDEPQDLYPSTLRRARVLDRIGQDSRLQANFIRRKQYRAGAQSPEARARTTQEFYDNMMASDYIVCVRGGGNFSVRLYETLATGRIPVFVNTDCLLPLPDQINWKEHVVWVEESQINSIGDIILDFHHKLTPASFRSLQTKNRKFWKEQMRIGMFFRIQLKTKIAYLTNNNLTIDE